jgi:hypothetical protein
MYYYELHCFFRRDDGYSIGMESEEDLGHDEDAIIELAVAKGLFSEDGDQYYVDYAEAITEQEYINYFKS